MDIKHLLQAPTPHRQRRATPIWPHTRITCDSRGTIRFYRAGVLHNDIGPAVIPRNGHLAYYRHGVREGTRMRRPPLFRKRQL